MCVGVALVEVGLSRCGPWLKWVAARMSVRHGAAVPSPPLLVRKIPYLRPRPGQTVALLGLHLQVEVEVQQQQVEVECSRSSATTTAS